MREIRVFLANSVDYYMNLDGQSDIENVMDCAEAQGTVMTLPKFVQMFNNGELNLSEDTTVIRMAEFEDGEFIREIE